MLGLKSAAYAQIYSHLEDYITASANTQKASTNMLFISKKALFKEIEAIFRPRNKKTKAEQTLY